MLLLLEILWEASSRMLGNRMCKLYCCGLLLINYICSALEIWRMENMTARPTPKEQYGKFFNGDAYIVLSVSVFKISSLEY